jgi:hypothetical protein
MMFFHYLKYFLFHAVGVAACAAIFAGGVWVPLGLAAVLVYYVIGDAVFGDDRSTPRFGMPGLLTAQLWLALPLVAVIVFAMVWSVSSIDYGGVGQWIQATTRYDVFAARAATKGWEHAAGVVLTILMIGICGTIPAHELTHRTWDPMSMLVGRWLLAFSFDTNFSIEHVYGHHRYVSTIDDPATAPRGRSVYFHILASTFKGHRSAWNIEKRRLKREGKAVFSPRNAVLRGIVMSGLLLAAAYEIGGSTGAWVFVVCALGAKALLEIVNYMEHYGMVRNPDVPVQPRHSWNTNRRISSWSMFNLTRHSYHHAQGEVPYQDLKPMSDAPQMINGYLTTIIVTLIPPLWHKLMTPKVMEWDRVYASAEEKLLAKKANAASGIRAMQAQT